MSKGDDEIRRARRDDDQEKLRELLHADLNIERFILDIVREKKANDPNVANLIIDGEIIQTIEGASNIEVTLHDPDRNLINSGVFHQVDSKGRVRPRAINVTLDGFEFRLQGVGKDGDDLSLVFEDLDVAHMREHRGPKKASRGKVTRAQFILMLVRAVKKRRIRFYCPELKKKQPIASKDKGERKELKDRERKFGIDPDAKLTIRHADGSTSRAKKYQKEMLERALDVADSLNAPELAQLALICALMIESGVTNPKGGDGTSVGPLQLIDIHYGGSVEKRRDLERVCHDFLAKGFTSVGGAIELAKKRGDWSPGAIAQAVQGSEFPFRYDQAKGEARKVLDAYGGVRSSRSLYKRYEFKVGSDQDYWEGALDLAEEVGWRLFMVRGWLYFIAEEDLINTRSRATISENTDGIDNIDWDIDEGRPVDEATVTCRINRWGVPPGAVVTLEDCGPANGRWIVSEIRRKLFSSEAVVKLKQPVKSKPEPRPELQEARDEDDEDVARNLDRVWDAAQYIHKKRFPYVWGGGHVPITEGREGNPGSAATQFWKRKLGRPTGGGYDCSGGVAAVLAAANMSPPEWENGVPTSGVMATTWGKKGKGRYLTMWANDGHVFLELRRKGKIHHLGTGDWGKGWRGFGINPNRHPTAGYTPRHWPGT